MGWLPGRRPVVAPLVVVPRHPAEVKLHPGRALMWVDDSTSIDLHEHMIASPLTPATLSWIQPRSTRGLDAEDLLSLRLWIADPTITCQIRRGTDYPQDENPTGGAEELHGH